MLDRLRQNSRSFIIWILFGIIIAAFVITFGPQSGEVSCGAGGDSYAVRVNGKDVSSHSWRFAYNGFTQLLDYFGGSAPHPSTARHIAIDQLVERELLAQAAEASGFRVSTEMVNTTLQNGELYVVGHRFPGKRAYFVNGVFDYDVLERFASQIGLPSVPYLVEEQRRELMADMMRDRLMSAVAVSGEEARSEYIQSNTKVTAEYVKFDVSRYAAAIKLDEPALDRFASAHDAELKKEWDRSKTTYEKAQPWVRARHILIRKDPPRTDEGDETSPEKAPAPDGDKPTDSPSDEPAGASPDKPADKTADKPADKKPADRPADKPADKASAKDRAEKARARIAAGAAFADVAREVSEDDRSKQLGGSLGWRPASSLGWGSELVEAAKALEPGKVSDVIESSFGYHVLVVEDKLDGALTFDKKKRDLAATLAPAYYARRRAELDAKNALAQAKEKPLDQLFEKGGPAMPSGPLPGTQDIPPEQLEQMLEQLQQQEENPETGWIVREGPTVLAQAGGAPQPAPAEPATPASADEPIPEAAGLEAPKLRTIGPVARFGDQLPDLGTSREVVDALFEELAPGSLADRVFETKEPESFVVVRLVSRTDADMAKFSKEEAAIRADIRKRKGVQLLTAWLQERCRTIATEGKIEVNRSFLYEDPEDKQQVPYNACQYIEIGSVLGQQQTRLLSDLF